MLNYSDLRSVADEVHWQEFVQRVGGELVSPLITREGVQNADFIFREARVVAELKVLETEFFENEGFWRKIADAVAKHPLGNPDEIGSPLWRELLRVLKAPLQRVVKKANRQIRETKRELGLVGWRGVVIIVNDGFRGQSPWFILTLLSDILASQSYSSCTAMIYQTNHYVELPDNPYANLLWAPKYAKNAPSELVDFVNDLGREWRKYSEAFDGPFDYSAEHERLDLTRAKVVRGPLRIERYTGEY